MKRIFCLLITACMAAATYGQREYPQRIFLGLNMKGGKLKETMSLAPPNLVYKSSLNSRITKPIVQNENAYGFDVQAGYFFGRKANWGISTGLLYLRYDGTLTIDSLHV